MKNARLLAVFIVEETQQGGTTIMENMIIDIGLLE